MISDLSKKELRANLKALRASIEPGIESELIRNNFLQNVPLQKNSIIATYIPTQSELNIDKLNRALGYSGYKLCLPSITAECMVFCEWGINTELVKNKFGILEPAPNTMHLTPDIVIVPILGFNAKKYRIGYGGGYYDRTFANSNAIKIGVAYAAQEVTQDFQETHDIPLDMVITEEKIFA